MEFDPRDVTKEEINNITKSSIFDENNISYVNIGARSCQHIVLDLKKA